MARLTPSGHWQQPDFAPIEQLQMMRFKGEKWELFGDFISGELIN